MSVKKRFSLAGCLAAVLFSAGCTAALPDGEVPESLVGEHIPERKILSQKDAEAAMCGAIVRALVRLGHASERTPLSFTVSSSPQRTEFVSLLTGTNMIWFCGADSAKYLVESKLEDGVWSLRLTKKDGSVILSKTVSYR